MCPTTTVCGMRVTRNSGELARTPPKKTALPKVKDLSDQPISDLLEASDSSGRLKDLKDDMSLNEIWDRPIKFLSGGELQRLAIAACLSRESEIYLLDEPSAYLDVEERLVMTKVIRKMIENGCGYKIQTPTDCLAKIKELNGTYDLLVENALSTSRLFSWEKTAAETLRVYKEVLNS